MADHKLTDVRGIGPKTAAGLATLGIDSIKALAAAPIELISTLPGFFASRAEAVKAAAMELTGTAAKPSRRPAGKAKPKRPAASTAPDKPSKKKKTGKKKAKKKSTDKPKKSKKKAAGKSKKTKKDPKAKQGGKAKKKTGKSTKKSSKKK
jgi:hypothetical protein